MKKLLLSFFSLILLGTTSLWGATYTGTQTTLKRGVYKYVITKDQIMADNGNWSSGAKNTLVLGPDITYTGYGANSTIFNNKSGGLWPRIYQTQNVVKDTPGGSVISANNGWIDSICIEYNVVSKGVISLTKENTSPVDDQYRIPSGKMHIVNATSFPFYIGSTGTNTDGRADITKITIYYKKYPTAITLPDMNISVGNTFQLLPTATTPSEVYPSYTWSSDNTDVVDINTSTGLLNAKTAGTANVTITAPNGIYATCAIKVDDNTFTSIIDTIKSAVTTGDGYNGNTAAVAYTGDNGIFQWIMRAFRRDATKDKIGNAPATRLCYNTTSGHVGKNYIAYANNAVALEGGVRQISFQWVAANSVNPVVFDIDNTANPKPLVAYKTYLFPSKNWQSTQTYTRDINLDQNGEFRINITAAEGAVVTFGPLTITPYLLYTTKTAEATGKYTHPIINNTTSAHTVVYSLADNDGEAEINTATGEVTCLAEGQVTVIATWGNVSTKYTLTTHAKPIPTVTFADQEVDMYRAAFTPTPTSIPSSGMGAASYSSDNKNAVRVNATSGELTIVGEGVANINVHYAEGTEWAAKDVSYKVTVTEPIGEGFVTENFKDAKFGAETIPHTIEGALAKWEYQYARRRYTAGYDFDTLQNGSHATWLNYNEEAYFATTEVMEGGIKRVSFLWNRASKDNRIAEFVLSTGAELQSKDTFTKAINDPVMRNIPDFVYNHNVFAKENSKLSIKGTGKKDGLECYLFFGDINIIPYLLYTKKADTINVLDYKDTPYINKDTIDNTDGGEITYSILTENASDIATINTSTGELTIKGGGAITVQAAWNDNKVKTTYTLVINKVEYTPAFAKTEETKTMNDSAFTNALNNVLSTGARTYKSSNERVATVNDTGLVAIQGPGTAKIKVEIAADGIYKKANAEYTLNVTEPTTDTDITEGFTGLTWGLKSTDPLNGDLGTWTTYYTRRTGDSIMSKGKKVGAEWMSGSEKGYLVSNAAIEGGVKRIYMTWVKTAPTQGQESKFLVQVGEIKDTFDCKDITNGTYLHNFNIRENSVIKVANASTNNFRAGPIVITPYIFYLKKNDTIMASKYVYPTVYKQALIDNTDGVGTIIIESDNTEAAEVLTGGDIKIKKAAENPVTITAKWQPDESVEKYVTTSYKLYISDRKQREATFAQPSVTVARGETPVNALDLQSPSGDSEPVVVYESSDTEVAVIGDGNAVLTVGPGTATITAHIGETNKCLAQDVSYTLTVTYSPGTGTYFTEYFPGTESATSYQTGPDTITGTDGLYKWGLKRYRRSSSDKVGGQQGIRICYDGKKSNAYLATIGAQEGGVKEVVFDYSVPGNADNPIHFYVQVGDSIHNFRHAPITTGGEAHPYAHDFSQKSNVKLSIMVDTLETPAQAAINVAPVKVIPYLLYTRKDTIVYAKDLAAKNYKFFNNKWYNNIKEGTVSYSIKAKDNAVVMDGDSVKIIGEGTDTIQASWEGVTTTYVIHVVLETPVLSFDDQEVNKKISESPYTQEVTLTTPATGTIVYSIVDDPEGASINSETGEVTMTAAGVYTIKATFPQQLPYKQGEATYQLKVTEKTVPQISFADANVDKDLLDAAFTNTLNAPEGVGAITYVSSNKDVATVDANGLVSMAKTTGSAIITAYAAENEEYAADSAKFTLNVTYTPVAGKVWKETFSKRNPQSSKDMTPRPTVGDSAIYNWTLTNYDYNNNDNFDGVIGVRVRYDGFMATDKMEGGIKALAFDWRASNNTNYIHYTVKVGEETTVFDSDPIPTTVTNRFTFARKYEQKSNTSFKFTIDTAGLTNTVAFLGVSPITIVPYLLFTATNHQVSLDLDQVQQFDLNTVLINNTGTDATFAVDSFKTDVTPVIENGKVTFDGITKGGKVYISATWAENPGVKTTLVINTTIKPEVSFAVPTPAAQNLVDGSYTNVLNAPEGVGAITYSSSNKQVATVDNNGVVTFLVAGTTTIKAKVAASDIYNKTEKSYNLTINGYTPVAGTTWTETFSRLSKTETYVSTEQKFQGDSLIYGWKINDYTRDSKDKPFRLRTNGYIATNGRQEGGIKYAALNWKPSASGNIDFTMKVNNDSYQYKGTVTKDQPYRFEHFFNADSIVPLEIKMASDGITAYMSVVDVTVVPYLLYTKKSKTISLGETFTNTDMIDNRGVGAADIEYSITKGETLADINTATGEVTAKDAGEVTVRATWGKVWTSYKLTITSDSEITLKDSEDNSQRIELYAGVENMTVHINRTFQAGTYNTISLPFATNKTDLATALGREITSLAKYNQSATLDDEKKNLDVEIKEVEDDEEMPAGTPYLLQFSGENVTNITFSDVTIVNTKGDTIGQGGTTQFIGTINPYMVSKDAKSVLFVVAGNKLAWNATGVDKPMNGFRAYFNVPGMTDQSGVAARLVMNQPTGWVNLNDNDNHNQVRKMVIDNQLIIIRNGVRYNANGQMLKMEK